jgi:hypothetical protein
MEYKKQPGLQIFLCLSIGLMASLSDAQTTGDFREVEHIGGSSRHIQEGARVFPFPRSDVKVTIQNTAFLPIK